MERTALRRPLGSPTPASGAVSDSEKRLRGICLTFKTRNGLGRMECHRIPTLRGGAARWKRLAVSGWERREATRAARGAAPTLRPPCGGRDFAAVHHASSSPTRREASRHPQGLSFNFSICAPGSPRRHSPTLRRLTSVASWLAGVARGWPKWLRGMGRSPEI